ncbi:MAG: hypothetical protein JNJ88_02915 [Planctomycetes bacterium]|nr:hypothetical protein [Planctomycetota bacterium]
MGDQSALPVALVLPKASARIFGEIEEDHRRRSQAVTSTRSDDDITKKVACAAWMTFATGFDENATSGKHVLALAPS